MRTPSPDKNFIARHWAKIGWNSLAVAGGALAIGFLTTHPSETAGGPSAPLPPQKPPSAAEAFLARAHPHHFSSSLDRYLPTVLCDMVYDKSSDRWQPYGTPGRPYTSPTRPELFTFGQGTYELLVASHSLASTHDTGFPMSIDTVTVKVRARAVKLHIEPAMQEGYKLPSPVDISLPRHAGKAILGHYDAVTFALAPGPEAPELALACNTTQVNSMHNGSSTPATHIPRLM